MASNKEIVDLGLGMNSAKINTKTNKEVLDLLKEKGMRMKQLSTLLMFMGQNYHFITLNCC